MYIYTHIYNVTSDAYNKVANYQAKSKPSISYVEWKKYKTTIKYIYNTYIKYLKYLDQNKFQANSWKTSLWVLRYIHYLVQIQHRPEKITLVRNGEWTLVHETLAYHQSIESAFEAEFEDKRSLDTSRWRGIKRISLFLQFEVEQVDFV